MVDPGAVVLSQWEQAELVDTVEVSVQAQADNSELHGEDGHGLALH